MINPRILMQLPLIFLGSCTPLSTYDGPQSEPQININLSLGNSGNEVRAVKVQGCIPEGWVMPAKPNVDHIPAEDVDALATELLNNIAMLRTELKDIVEACKAPK